MLGPAWGSAVRPREGGRGTRSTSRPWGPAHQGALQRLMEGPEKTAKEEALASVCPSKRKGDTAGAGRGERASAAGPIGIGRSTGRWPTGVRCAQGFVEGGC